MIDAAHIVVAAWSNCDNVIWFDTQKLHSKNAFKMGLASQPSLAAAAAPTCKLADEGNDKNNQTIKELTGVFFAMHTHECMNINVHKHTVTPMNANT